MRFVVFSSTPFSTYSYIGARSRERLLRLLETIIDILSQCNIRDWFSSSVFHTFHSISLFLSLSSTASLLTAWCTKKVNSIGVNLATDVRHTKPRSTCMKEWKATSLHNTKLWNLVIFELNFMVRYISNNKPNKIDFKNTITALPNSTNY